ncbi:MAG TPA: alpha/beta hydrolase [Thermoanaerobaculia bacterium]|jgi:pimeloyl-ACP methyl ester carboxylesterase
MTETVLLIHSGGFTSRQWRRLAETLAPEFNVLAPDLLGYGAREPWPDGKPFHFSADLELLLTLIEGPVHLVGHSYGGFLALQLALARPELVRSIAAFDPVGFAVLDEVDDADAREGLSRVKLTWDRDASGVDEAWLAAFVDWWNGPGAWTRLPEETRGAFRSVGWKVYQEVMTLAADRSNYAAITAPTLILGGANSPLAERRVVEKLGALLPNARAQLLEGVGHMGPITHAALVNAAIAEHLRSAS